MIDDPKLIQDATWNFSTWFQTNQRKHSNFQKPKKDSLKSISSITIRFYSENDILDTVRTVRDGILNFVKTSCAFQH